MRLYVGLGRARASRYFCQVMTIFPWNSKRLPRILNQRHILKCVLVKFGDSSRNVSIILYKAYSVPTYIPPSYQVFGSAFEAGPLPSRRSFLSVTAACVAWRTPPHLCLGLILSSWIILASKLSCSFISSLPGSHFDATR